MRVALVLLGSLVHPLGGLWPFAVDDENRTCDKAGACAPGGPEPTSSRGSDASPGAAHWWFNWSWEGPADPKASTAKRGDGTSGSWPEYSGKYGKEA